MSSSIVWTSKLDALLAKAIAQDGGSIKWNRARKALSTAASAATGTTVSVKVNDVRERAAFLGLLPDAASATASVNASVNANAETAFMSAPAAAAPVAAKPKKSKAKAAAAAAASAPVHNDASSSTSNPSSGRSTESPIGLAMDVDVAVAAEPHAEPHAEPSDAVEKQPASSESEATVATDEPALAIPADVPQPAADAPVAVKSAAAKLSSHLRNAAPAPSAPMTPTLASRPVNVKDVASRFGATAPAPPAFQMTYNFSFTSKKADGPASFTPIHQQQQHQQQTALPPAVPAQEPMIAMRQSSHSLPMPTHAAEAPVFQLAKPSAVPAVADLAQAPHHHQQQQQQSSSLTPSRSAAMRAKRVSRSKLSSTYMRPAHDNDQDSDDAMTSDAADPAHSLVEEEHIASVSSAIKRFEQPSDHTGHSASTATRRPSASQPGAHVRAAMAAVSGSGPAVGATLHGQPSIDASANPFAVNMDIFNGQSTEHQPHAITPIANRPKVSDLIQRHKSAIAACEPVAPARRTSRRDLVVTAVANAAAAASAASEDTAKLAESASGEFSDAPVDAADKPSGSPLRRSSRRGSTNVASPAAAAPASPARIRTARQAASMVDPEPSPAPKTPRTPSRGKRVDLLDLASPTPASPRRSSRLTRSDSIGQVPALTQSTSLTQTLIEEPVTEVVAQPAAETVDEVQTVKPLAAKIEEAAPETTADEPVQSVDMAVDMDMEVAAAVEIEQSSVQQPLFAPVEPQPTEQTNMEASVEVDTAAVQETAQEIRHESLVAPSPAAIRRPSVDAAKPSTPFVRNNIGYVFKVSETAPTPSPARPVVGKRKRGREVAGTTGKTPLRTPAAGERVMGTPGTERNIIRKRLRMTGRNDDDEDDESSEGEDLDAAAAAESRPKLFAMPVSRLKANHGSSALGSPSKAAPAAASAKGLTPNQMAVKAAANSRALTAAYVAGAADAGEVDEDEDDESYKIENDEQESLSTDSDEEFDSGSNASFDDEDNEDGEGSDDEDSETREWPMDHETWAIRVVKRFAKSVFFMN